MKWFVLGMLLFIPGLALAISSLTIIVQPLANNVSTPNATYHYTFVVSAQTNSCQSFINMTQDLTMNSTGGATTHMPLGDLKVCGITYCEYRNGTLRSIQPINISINGGLCPGFTGAQGPPGPQGVPGVNGLNGANGINGLNGTNGINGTNGANGTNGLNGADGVNGVNGVNGTNGVNGLNGSQGVPGINGTNGANGTNGLNGTNGINGTNALNGTNGLNATANWSARDGLGGSFLVGNGGNVTWNGTSCLTVVLASNVFNLSINQSCLIGQLNTSFNPRAGWLNTTTNVYLADNTTNVSMGSNTYLPGGNGTAIILNPNSGAFGITFIQLSAISNVNPTGRLRLGYNGSLNLGTIVLDDGGTSKNILLSTTSATSGNNIQFVVGNHTFIINSTGAVGINELPTQTLSVNGSSNVSNQGFFGSSLFENNNSRVCTAANRLCENVTTGITGNFTVVQSVNLLALTSTSCTFRFQNGTLRSTTC